MSRSPLDALGSAKTDKSFAYTADFLAAIFTWGGIGYLIDRLAGTGPLAMVIGFIVGNACGIYLLYIRSREADRARDALDPQPPIAGAHPHLHDRAARPDPDPTDT